MVACLQQIGPPTEFFVDVFIRASLLCLSFVCLNGSITNLFEGLHTFD